MFHDTAPLAERMRPKSLSEIIGQGHLVGDQGILRKAIISGRIPSIILWGPPGIGKTTLANIIANEAKVPFHVLSAISAGVKDLRDVIAKGRPGQKNILFIDEIHRFNKSQQDALLGAVEKGKITLIGATTENPSFEVNAALLSRVQVYRLNPLTSEELNAIMMQAIEKDDNLKTYKIIIKNTEAIFNLSGGDARKLLNILEQVVTSQKSSKAIITDSNKDITGGRNITISGELDAATLDISGDADIDGTLEADAITIAGVTLAETISDTVGAMVSSNTETNITVTYDDSDNTLDFVIGTLNQDTTGTADNITVSANNSTDETVYPIFVDGATGSQGAETDTGLSYNPSSGNLTIGGELIAATLDISGNVDIDGTLEADAITINGATLAETISDTVGAMVSSNTETNSFEPCILLDNLFVY